MVNYLKNIHSTFTDAVFENKNKEYGAYQLRKSYNKHINKALLIANLIVVAFILFLFCYFKFKSSEEIYEVVDYKTIDFSLEKVEIPSIQSNLPPPPKMQTISENAPPVVKEEVKEKKNESEKKEESKQTEKIDGKGNDPSKENGNEAVKSTSSDTSGKQLYSNEIFMKVEIPAEFPGGQMGMGKFLGENIKYPDYALQNKVDGIVYIHMVINTDGSVSDLKIYKGIEQSCNEEVLRVMKMSPKWIPARQKGLYVRQRIIVPIRFKAP